MTLGLGVVLFGLGCSPPPPAEGPEGHWRQWRGPNRDGVVPADAPLVRAIDLVQTLPNASLAWTRSIGPGFSGVSVADGRAYTLHATGDREALIALDARSGARLWSRPLGERFESSHGDGPRSTPAVHGTRTDGMVVALGSYGRLVGVDASNGTERWRVELRELTDGRFPTWGFAASPLIFSLDGLRVAIQADAGATLVVVELDTGAIDYTVDLGAGSYTSPRLVDLLGEPQLLVLGGDTLAGIEPRGGAVRWRHPWPTSLALNAADPLPIGDDAVLVSNAHDSGAGLVRLTPSPTGFHAHTVWNHRRFRLHWASPIAFESPTAETLAVGLDEHFLIGLHPDDGTIAWKARGPAAGGLVRVGDRLLILGESGRWLVGEPSAEGFRPLVERPSDASGPCRTPPAVVDSWVLVRCNRSLLALHLDDPSEIPGRKRRNSQNAS